MSDIDVGKFCKKLTKPTMKLFIMYSAAANASFSIWRAIYVQASKQERQKLLAAVHPHACDDSSSIAQDALQAVKNSLQCSKLEAKGIAELSGAAAALQGFKQNLRSHISSICHVETHVVEDVQCRRDLLQMCNDIESMPCMSEQQTSESAGRTDPDHSEL